MENDLISRSELRKGLEMRYMTELYPEWRTLSLGVKEKIGRLAEAFRKAIDSAPTSDAVPVVRCNRCKYYEQETGFCQYFGGGNHYDGFCNNGARMDAEDTA